MKDSKTISYSVWTLSSGGWYQYSEQEESLGITQARLEIAKEKFSNRPSEHFKIRRHIETVEDL